LRELDQLLADEPTKRYRFIDKAAEIAKLDKQIAADRRLLIGIVATALRATGKY
jgi:hypothetical protein